MSSSKVACILLGAGGHAKVVAELAEAMGLTIVGVCDPKLEAQRLTSWNGYKVLGDDRYVENQAPERVQLLNGIGKMPGSSLRKVIYQKFSGLGFRFPVLIHPSAWVSPTAKLEQGVQIMAGAIVQAYGEVGENTIINTKASVDHDCAIGKHCHIAPGVSICGGVTISGDCFVGAGATLIQGVSVKESTSIRAGSLVTRDL